MRMLLIFPMYPGAIIRIGLALALAVLSGANAAQQQPKAAEFGAKATAAVGRNQFAEALSFAEEALKLDPNNETALVEKGRALRGLERLDEALAHLERAVAQQPKSSRLHNTFGVTLERAKQLPRAIEEYAEAVRLAPKDAVAQGNLGNAYRLKGDFARAETELRQAIALNPTYANAHTNLGTTLLRLNRTDEALVEYQEALRLSPNDKVAQTAIERANAAASTPADKGSTTASDQAHAVSPKGNVQGPAPTNARAVAGKNAISKPVSAASAASPVPDDSPASRRKKSTQSAPQPAVAASGSAGLEAPQATVPAPQASSRASSAASAKAKSAKGTVSSSSHYRLVEVEIMDPWANMGKDKSVNLGKRAPQSFVAWRWQKERSEAVDQERKVATSTVTTANGRRTYTKAADEPIVLSRELPPEEGAGRIEWSVPEQISFDTAARFRLAASAAGSEDAEGIVTIAAGNGTANNLAAVRATNSASAGTGSKTNAPKDEFSLTLPSELQAGIEAWLRKPTDSDLLARRVTVKFREAISFTQGIPANYRSAEFPSHATEKWIEDWVVADDRKVADLEVSVYVRAGAGMFNKAARYVYRWNGPAAGKGDSAVAINPVLDAVPDLVELAAQSGQSVEIKVAIDDAGPGRWQFRTEYARGDRALAQAVVRPLNEKSAVLELKEAGLELRHDGSTREGATLKIFAEQSGREPLERDIRVNVAQEGLFVGNLGRDPATKQFRLEADGKRRPTEIDFLIFAKDPKSGKIVNITSQASAQSAVTLECLEPRATKAGRLLEAGEYKQEFRGVRSSNEPSGIIRLTLGRELPADGGVVPCDFRLTYTPRNEEAFTALLTVGIATTANGPGGQDWKRELDRCQEVIDRFVPAKYTPKLQAMLDRRKMTLGAEGLHQLRNRIWSAAQALTLGEGGRGYADEAAWAGTITEALEWTQWAGDLAFGAAIGTFTGPFGATGAGMLKTGVLAAIEAYDEGRRPEEWLWDQFATLPAMLEGKIIDVDNFQSWGVQSRAKAWAIYISYTFLKNLYNGQSVIEALQNTVKDAGNNVLAGWLNGEVARNRNRTVTGYASDKATELHQNAAQAAGVAKEAVNSMVAPKSAAENGTQPAPAPAPTAAPAATTRAVAQPGPAAPPAKQVSDAERLVSGRTTQTYDGKPFAHPDDVREIMSDPSMVRALKEASPAAQDAFNNTRESIYRAHDAQVELYLREKAATDPELAHLQGRKLKVMEFRTPGASSRDINTDRDYRVSYLAGKDKNGVEMWVEVPRKHWEDKSYESFARLTGGPADNPAEARAWAEKHQQLATDKDHAEASAAYSDQKRYFNKATRKFEQVQIIGEKRILNQGTGRYESKFEATSNIEEVTNLRNPNKNIVDLEDPQSLGRMFVTKVADARFKHEKMVQANKAVDALIKLRMAYNVEGRPIGELPESILKGIAAIQAVNKKLKEDPNRRDPAAIREAERHLREEAKVGTVEDLVNKVAGQLESLKWMNRNPVKRGVEVRDPGQAPAPPKPTL